MKKLEPLDAINVFVNLTLQALELNLVSIELLRNHPTRGHLIYTTKRMATYLLEKVETVEVTIDDAVRSASDKMIHESAFVRDVITDAQKQDKGERVLKEIATAVSTDHNKLVKALGEAENEAISDVSQEFKKMKDGIKAFLVKVDNLSSR